MCHMLWITIFYSPPSPFLLNDFGCMLQAGVITSPTQTMQCFFWKFPQDLISKIGVPFSDPSMNTMKKKQQKQQLVPPISSPLPIKILLPPQKKTPTISATSATFYCPSRLNPPGSPKNHGFGKRLGSPYKRALQQREEAFFLGQIVRLAGCCWSLYPVEFFPKKPRLLDNTPGVLSENTCVLG